MKIAILGASGRTGRHLVDQAIARGHTVTALVRDPAKLSDRSDPLLEVVPCAATDPEQLADRLVGHEAVISAIGPTSGGPTTVCTDSVRAIVAAMNKAGLTRVLVTGVAAAHTGGDGPFTRFVVKPMLQRLVLRHVVVDALRMEEILRSSSLEWTIMRPPMLTDKPLTRDYRTRTNLNVRGGFRIPRADLAHSVLGALEDPDTVRTDLSVAT